ncbi:MAG: response regulator [Betaproteobacteria bacterium]|nr:response regulator [Betaproteobacteria bacterium]
MKTPRTVVLIDDDNIMRQMLRLVLNSADFQVVGEAGNGLDGIDICKKCKPDIVLLDIAMPKMDGLLALELILAMNPATKVIMASVESKKDKVLEAIRRGAVGFVVKPLNPATVLDRIESCFQRKDQPWPKD